MVEISGISRQWGENVIDLIGKVVVAANITGYDQNQIGIVRRTSSRPTTLIMIMFDRNRDRKIIYKQKNEGIKSNFIIKKYRRSRWGTSAEVSLNENLTQENSKQFKEAKKGGNKLKYQYPDYTVNGDSRVRKSANEDHIPILCKCDLDKIT